MNLEKLSVGLKTIHFVRFALAALLINLLVWIFLVLPKKNRIENLQSSYARLRTQVASDQKELRELESRVKKLQQAQKDLKTIYSSCVSIPLPWHSNWWTNAAIMYGIPGLTNSSRVTG